MCYNVIVFYPSSPQTRGSKIMKSDDPDDPTRLDEMVSSLGGEPLEFTGKTKCCGGGILMTYRKTATKLAEEILTEALNRGAQCILVTCPLCHMTLESLANKVKTESGKAKIPILYFTQLMGLSFGIDPKKLGLHKNIVSPKAVLNHLG